MKLIEVVLILKKLLRKVLKFWDKIIDVMKSLVNKLQKVFGEALKGCKVLLKKTVNGAKAVFERIIRAYSYIKNEWIVHEKVYKVSEDKVPEDIRRKVRNSYLKEDDITSEAERELMLATSA